MKRHDDGLHQGVWLHGAVALGVLVGWVACAPTVRAQSRVHSCAEQRVATALQRRTADRLRTRLNQLRVRPSLSVGVGRPQGGRQERLNRRIRLSAPTASRFSDLQRSVSARVSAPSLRSGSTGRASRPVLLSQAGGACGQRRGR